mmetsp:Transcript_22696/g.42748  ORF Transcript_22696/g.42748 Transcript_22696/m.42748 type:complete len:290 (-) Transcript_22696:740-1609(-)
MRVVLGCVLAASLLLPKLLLEGSATSGPTDGGRFFPFIGSLASSSSSLLSLTLVESPESLLELLLSSSLSSSVKMSVFTCLDLRKSKSEEIFSLLPFSFSVLLVASSSLSESELLSLSMLLLLSLSPSFLLPSLFFVPTGAFEADCSPPGPATKSSFAQNFDFETLSSFPPCLEDAEIPMADKNSSRLRLTSSVSLSSSSFSSFPPSSFFDFFFESTSFSSSSCFSCCNCSYFELPTLCLLQGRYESPSPLAVVGGPFFFENAKLTDKRAVPAKVLSKYSTADFACSAV